LSVVLVDQDGVLANFEQGLLDAFRARHPDAPFIPLADRREFYARKQYPPEWAEHIGAIVRAEGFYRDLPAIEGSVAAMGEMLKSGHEVFVCTAPMISSRWCVQEKLAWVEHHLGRDWLRRTIIASDKTLIGDRFQPCVLIDDRPTITGAAIPPWTHVLFDAPYNQGQPGPRLFSWTHWREVIEPILAAQSRERTHSRLSKAAAPK
jgi:5'-nucleotidase